MTVVLACADVRNAYGKGHAYGLPLVSEYKHVCVTVMLGDTATLLLESLSRVVDVEAESVPIPEATALTDAV